jgi:autotransporter-associated beta strand protein
MITFIFTCAVQSTMAGTTWDGGDSSDNWNFNNNWNPDGSPTPGTGTDLFFGGTTRLTPYNNYGDWQNWRHIYFTSGAGSFTISGDNINIYGKIENSDDSPQSFNVNNFSYNSGSSEANPVSGDLTLGGGGSIFNNGNDVNVYGDNGHDLIILKDLTHAGKLILQQYSVVRIATNTTYTGNTELNEGELWLEENGSISASSSVFLGNGGATANYCKWFINDANGGYTFSSTITLNDGNGGIDNRTVGGLNTSGVNTYSGTIAAAGGADRTLTLFAATGGTVDYTADVTGDDKLFVAGGGITRYSTSAKAHTGDAIVTNSSTLQLNAANLINDAVDVIVGDNSTFDLNGNTETVEAVYGNGNVSLGAAQLIVNHTTTRTLSGVVSGTGSFVKKGSGSLTFDGANSYSGETYPVGGILQIGATPDAGLTGTVRLGETSGSDAATFGTSAGGVDVSNDIVVRSGSSGTLTIAANNTTGIATFSGDITLSNNVDIASTAGAGTIVLSGTLDLEGNTAFIRNNNDATIGAITGSGTLEKASGSGGTLILNGDVNVGNVFFNDGGMRIVAGGNITGGNFFLGSSVIQNNTTLDLAVSGIDFDRPIEVEDAGSSEVKKVLTSVAGTALLSGAIQLDNTDLVLVPTNGSTLTLSGNVDMDFDGENDLTIEGPGDVTLSGALSSGTGNSDINVTGSGTVTLAGDNTGESFQIEHGSGTVYLNSANALGTSYSDKIKINGDGNTLRVGATMGPAALGIQINGNYGLTLNTDAGATLTVAGAVDDGANAADLTKVGDGTVLLNGANNIDGTTLVTAGILGGTGSISGALDIDGGGTVSPGASVGTLSAGATTWNTNGIYVWEINDFTGTYGTDPGWDKLDITGDLDIDATAAKTFTIKITSLNGSVAGNAANFDNSSDYTQSIASASASINNFVANKFTLDTAGFSNDENGGTWSIEEGAGTIDLVFTAPTPPTAPVATAATNVTASSFYANWNASAGATSYRLDVFQLDEDFTDGNASTNLVWSGDTGPFSVFTDATLPDAVASTDGSFLGTPDGPGAAIITTPSTETNEWRFSLGTSDFDPSGANHFGVILMSDTEVTGDAHASSSNWRGYYLRIGATGTDDAIQLRRKTGTGNSSVGAFTAGASGANGLQDGLNIRVTRSATGDFSLWTSAGFEYDQDAATFAGTLTDTAFDVADTTHFGIWADMTAGSRQLYVDNIDFGAINYVAGYEDKTITPTTDLVTGLGANTPYVYRVRAVNGIGPSDNSNYISVETDSVNPTAIAATSVTVDSFDANWNAVAGALSYELDVFEANEDFADGDNTIDPAWAGDTGDHAVLTDATVPNGNATTDGSFMGTAASSGDTSLSIASTEVNEWRFSWASGDFDPSTGNFISIVLMASAAPTTGISGSTFTGYFLKIGASGTADKIELWRKTGAGEVSVGDFSTASYGTGALEDGVNVRVTRDANGVFELYYDAGFTYATEPATYAGALTNATYSSSSFFGVCADIGSPSADRRGYVDNIVFGSSLNTLSGYAAKSVAGTSDAVTGASGFTEYFYQVRAVTAGGTSDDSNVIAVETLDTPPSAIAATDIDTTSFTANWNAVIGASSYGLDVFEANEDFNDGDFSASPVWAGDTGDHAVLTDTTVPNGNAATDASFMGTAASSGDTSLSIASTEVSEWRFSWASGAFNPSTANFISIVLMASAAPATGISGSTFTGYFLKIGASGSADKIELWRKTGAGEVSVGDFSTASYGTGALEDGVNLRVTRDANGVFELYYDTGFIYAAEPATYAGALTNATYSSSSFFGVCADIGSPSADRRGYVDNVVLGSSLNYVAGYNNKSVAGTSDSVTGLSVNQQYMYHVRAVLERATTGNSNLISATTTGSASLTVFKFK